MATLPGTTVPEGVDPASLDASLVTAGDGAQPGVLPTGEADLGVTSGSGLESTGGQAPPAPVPPAVPPVGATPGSTAFESARSRRLPPVGSTPQPPGIAPGVFTPGPTHGSWVYTPLPVGTSSARGTAVTGSTGLPETSTPGTGQAFPPLASYGAGSSKTGNRSSRRRRRRRRRSSTSETSSSSSEEGYDWDASPGPTRRRLVEFDFPAHQVGDATLNKVTYWGNYRLENQDQGYTRKMAKKMASLNRRMQPSFGGHPKFSGKRPALIFAFLRRFVKACNDNDVSEGKALYLLVNFMTGEAEQRFAQVLPDSAGHIVGRTVASYPEAVNWLLSNYADADSLRKAVGRLNRATMERQETPEAFARRVREMSDACGNVYPEDRLKMIFSEGLPEYLQVDAENYNQEHQEHTFQQLMAYTQGKYRQARALQAPMVSTPKPLSRVRPGPDKYKGGDSPVPVLAVGEASPMESRDKWGGFVSKEQPSLVAPKQIRNQRFRSCWLCQKEDHMSYQCPTIPKDLQEKLKRQGLVFAKAVNWADRRAPSKMDKAQVHAIRVATLQSITEALAREAPTDFDLETETSKDSSDPGNE